MKYVCKTICQYNGRVYKQGESLDFSGEVVKCECKEKDNKGVCRTCMNSGRLIPPRHFVPADKARAEEVKIDQNDANDLKDLRKQLKELDVPFDNRWGKNRLESELVNAQKLNSVKK